MEPYAPRESFVFFLWFIRPRFLFGLFIVVVIATVAFFGYGYLNSSSEINAMRADKAVIDASNQTINQSVQALTQLPDVSGGKLKITDALHPEKALQKAGNTSTAVKNALNNAVQAIPNLKTAFPRCGKRLISYTRHAVGVREAKVRAAGLPWTNEITCQGIPANIRQIVGL